MLVSRTDSLAEVASACRWNGPSDDDERHGEAIASRWQPMATLSYVAIPDFQTMMRPVLVAIEGDESRSTAQIRDKVAIALDISDEDRLVMLPTGKQALFTNRVAWAITHMSQAGLLNRPERGRYLLSERGRKGTSHGVNLAEIEHSDTVVTVPHNGSRWRVIAGENRRKVYGLPTAFYINHCSSSLLTPRPDAMEPTAILAPSSRTCPHFTAASNMARATSSFVRSPLSTYFLRSLYV